MKSYYKTYAIISRSVRKEQCLLIASLIMLNLFLAGCYSSATKSKAYNSKLPVKVEPILIHQLGSEHFGNAIYRRGKEGTRIAASGTRILEWPIHENAPVTEVVPYDSARYNNGACAIDVNNDNIDEMNVARTVNNSGTNLLWFEEVAGQKQWREHLIGYVANEEGEPGIHDIMPFEVKVLDTQVAGVVILVNRRRLFWYQIPDNTSQPWIQHFIADLHANGAEVPQSGLALGDINGDGRMDLVCGNFWAECPSNTINDSWQVHRYSTWDRRSTPIFPEIPVWVKDEPFGGMNQLDLGDMDADGKLDIVATDAEIPDARIGVFCRNSEEPNGLWTETVIDKGLYCPHSLVLADVNKDNRMDILTGEMTAGGWWFPRTPSPKLYLYLNQGNMKFQKYILHEGWGIHMMRMAQKQPQDKIFIFAADEIQSWYKDMTTHIVGWTISPKQ